MMEQEALYEYAGGLITAKILWGVVSKQFAEGELSDAEYTAMYYILGRDKVRERVDDE
jgi:nitrogen fixation-related uncharacterized protein